VSGIKTDVRRNSIAASAKRYWHTLRYLRPVQVYGRIWFQFKTPAPDNRAAPHPRRLTGTWSPAVKRPSSMDGGFVFNFLNRQAEVNGPTDWNAPGVDKLWLYNLHYFDDLNAIDASSRLPWHEGMINRWILDNPPGQGNGWESYPLSLRLVNWIKWAMGGNALNDAWVQSLAVQTRYLQARIEWHLLGNHLLANAKALLFAGCFFEGSESDTWRNTALEVLKREVQEQILPDGGHFELSPMYHSIILEDLLDLINLTQAYPDVVPDSLVDTWVAVVTKMRRWLLAMLHPDNQISFFNDSALGIANLPEEVEAYAEQLGMPAFEKPSEELTHLSDSGYVRVQRANEVAILDLAGIGPDYLPGHAHADTLSFELSLFGQRTLVNSGTSVYGTCSERQRQRSTSAHNTVEIDSRNSSEVWDGFRVAQRARPCGLEIEEHDSALNIRCAHDGYHRLPGRVTHEREWCFLERTLTIKDMISGGHQTAVARFHLHPDVSAQYDGTQGVITLSHGQKIHWKTSDGIARLIPTTWHPEFGLSVPNQCLEVTFTQTRCTTTFSW